MIRLMAVFAVLLAAAGCVATQPDYSYNAAASDPVLIFQSDFKYHTFFYVNTDPDSGDVCQNFKSVGYTLYADSVLIIGTAPNSEVQVRAPAGRPVAVKAHYNFTAGLGNENCGPIYVSFTPEKGKTYLVRMVKDETRCTVLVTDTSQPNVLVPATGLPGCK